MTIIFTTNTRLVCGHRRCDLQILRGQRDVKSTLWITDVIAMNARSHIFELVSYGKTLDDNYDIEAVLSGLYKPHLFISQNAWARNSTLVQHVTLDCHIPFGR